jgi:hypothetical protein
VVGLLSKAAATDPRAVLLAVALLMGTTPSRADKPARAATKRATERWIRVIAPPQCGGILGYSEKSH